MLDHFWEFHVLAKSHHLNGSHVNSYGTNDELNRKFTWHAAMLIASVGNGAVACVCVLVCTVGDRSERNGKEGKVYSHTHTHRFYSFWVVTTSIHICIIHSKWAIPSWLNMRCTSASISVDANCYRIMLCIGFHLNIMNRSWLQSLNNSSIECEKEEYVNNEKKGSTWCNSNSFELFYLHTFHILLLFHLEYYVSYVFNQNDMRFFPSRNAIGWRATWFHTRGARKSTIKSYK